MNHPGTLVHTLTDKLVARKDNGIGWIVFNKEGQTAFMEKRKPVFQGR